MFAIGLVNPTNPINVGHVLRAADAFGASMVAITGTCKVRSVTDTSGASSRIPIIRGLNIRDTVPWGCIPIAVELLANAQNLCTFEHPRKAFYIFGAENATLGRNITEWCKYIVYVPTKICLNLSACVNVVCYDRIAKELIKKTNQS